MEALHQSDYPGIRPAPGYPTCPEHTVKSDIFNLLGCEKMGMTLTESFAMSPTASLVGFYFSHPDARYFTIGKIVDD